MILIISFWTLGFLVVYCYFGYPFFIWLFAKAFERRVKRGAFEPTVSVVLSVWNEEDVIERRVKNFLSLDYPREKLEIIIGSDGSEDRTNAIVREFQDDRLCFVEGTQRKGKMSTLNELVSRAKNEIIVFTDARQWFAADAIRNLVENFADPKVGCVSGELMFVQQGGGTAKGINLYWNYEKFIRSQESEVHSMLGATGAIYAIRKALFDPFPEKIILDDVYLPLKIIRKGYRAILDGRAKAFDDVADNPQEEFNRKARTLFGNYQVFSLLPKMFHPLKSPVAFQLFSHKLLRLLIPFFLMSIFILNLFLLEESIYQATFLGQSIFYALAAIGGLARKKKYGMLKGISKMTYVPYVFCLLNYSAVVGFWRFITNQQSVTWDKARDV